MVSSPIFGVFITLFAYFFAVKISKMLKTTFANPLLISIFLVISILHLFKIPYDKYMIGASYIQFMILPATILLAVPFYKNLNIFLKYKKPIILASLAGAVTSMLFIYVCGRIFRLDRPLLVSLLPKSITTATGMPLAEQNGGLSSIASFAITITGIAGSILSDHMFKILDIKDHMHKGSILGTASHAIGTSKAIEISEKCSAISGLALVLTGLITVVIFPFAMLLI